MEAKLSYRLSECYINSHHHTQWVPLGFCVCVPSVRGGQHARRCFNWHGREPNDGWMAGRRETVSQCLFLSRWQPSASSTGYSQHCVSANSRLCARSVAFWCVCTYKLLLYAHSISPVISVSIANTDTTIKECCVHSRAVNTTLTPLELI